VPAFECNWKRCACFEEECNPVEIGEFGGECCVSVVKLSVTFSPRAKRPKGPVDALSFSPKKFTRKV